MRRQSTDRESPSAAPWPSATVAARIAQRLQKRLLVAVDIDDGAAAVNGEADGGTLGARAFQHYRAVVDDLNRRVELFDLHRNGYRLVAHRDEVIDVDGVFAGDDSADTNCLLADRRQHLAPVDEDEIIGAATVVAIEQHESGFAPTIPDHIADRVLHEHVEIVGMLVGPTHRDQKFGLAVDLAVLCLRRDRKQRDKKQKGKNLQRLEQHDREGIEWLFLRHQLELVDHSAAPG